MFLLVGMDKHDIHVLWKVLRQSLGDEWRKVLLQHASGLLYGGLFLLPGNSTFYLMEVRVV